MRATSFKKNVTTAFDSSQPLKVNAILSHFDNVKYLYFGVMTFLQPALSSSSFLRFPESLSGTPYSIFLNLNLKAPCYIQGFSTKHTVRILDVTNMMNLFPSSENIFKINNSEWSFLLAVFFFLASAGTLLYFLAQKLHGVPFILGSTWLEQSIGGLFNRQKRNQQFRQWCQTFSGSSFLNVLFFYSFITWISLGLEILVKRNEPFEDVTLDLSCPFFHHVWHFIDWTINQTESWHQLIMKTVSCTI